MYMWNGFDLIPHSRLVKLGEAVDIALSQLDKQQEDCKALEKEIPYSSFYDDLCLVRFFKGLIAREISYPTADTLVPERIMMSKKVTKEQEKGLDYAAKQLEFLSLQADDIQYDHWILPFARYELASLYLRKGNYARAKSEYQAALNGGYADDEAGKQKKKASMETSLHIRIHNAVQKLNFMLSLQGGVAVEAEGGDEPERDDDSDEE
jgi:hypothetical protein